MTSSSYWSFLAFATVLVLVPGPDFAVVMKNSLAGGRRRGGWTAVGVATSNAVQGAAAAVGLGAIVLRSQPLFELIRWAGVAYLAYLGVQALATAYRGAAPELGEGGADRSDMTRGFRQGFLSNITNPKVLVFYIAVLPQFLAPGAGVAQVFGLAVTHALLSLGWLLVVVVAFDRARHWFVRRRVRRLLDAATGTVLLGFSARLATEHR